MEIRKLQCTGGGCYILSLPKKWIEKYSLDKGDSFALFEQENGFSLPRNLMRKRKNRWKLQVEITPCDKTNSAAYCLGWAE